MKKAAQREFAESKLVDLCLETIVDNFDLFMTERASPKNIPSEHFDFLEKTYSTRLYEDLGETKYFLKYMDFFLNEHQTEVDLGLCFRHISRAGNRIFERLKIIGHKITLLAWTKFPRNSTAMLLELIPRLQNLKTLVVEKADASIIQGLGKYCASLESLSLERCVGIGDREIEYLCPIKEDGSVRKNDTLNHMKLVKTSVTKVGVAFILKHFPNILELKHKHLLKALYSIHADYLKESDAAVFPTFKLNVLKVSNGDKELTPEFCQVCALLCPDVYKIKVRQSIAVQSKIDAYSKFTKLQNIHFDSYAGIATKYLSFSPFFQCRGGLLEKLYLCNVAISVALLLQCSRLKEISLNDVEFEPIKEFNDLLKYRLENLEALFIGKADFKVELVRKSVKLLFHASINVEELVFFMSSSLDSGFMNSIVECSCMKVVKKVDMESSPLAKSTVETFLMATPNLEFCKLSRCRLSAEDIEYLQALLPSADIMT